MKTSGEKLKMAQYFKISDLQSPIKETHLLYLHPHYTYRSDQAKPNEISLFYAKSKPWRLFMITGNYWTFGNKVRRYTAHPFNVIWE